MKINFKKVLKEKIKRSPIPVIIESLPKYKRYLSASGEMGDFKGIVGEMVLYNNSQKAGYPKQFIWINSRLKVESKLTCLEHEMHHYKSVSSNESNISTINEEFGAYKSELKLAMKLRSREMVKSVLHDITNVIIKNHGGIVHVEACKKLIKDELFIKAVHYLAGKR